MKNLLREKVDACATMFGSHIWLNDPSVCELLGTVGYDYIWIDMEHSYLSYEAAFSHIVASHAAGTASLVRVPQDDFASIKKVVDMGPDAIVFPMVSSREQADRLIEATLYPPIGKRGFGPMRASRYGCDDMAEYIETESKKLCRFVQIEQLSAIECLEEIVESPYIDGYIFGPNDLSGSIGRLGCIYDEENVGMIRKGAKLLKRYHKNIGISLGDASEDQLRLWKEMGFNMISSGTDFTHILNGAKNTLQALKSL